MLDQNQDGSHHVTLNSIRFRDCPLYPKTEGWLKWTATEGVELEFTFHDLFRVEQSAYYRPTEEMPCGVGRFVTVDLSLPDWTALTIDGTEVRIYGFLGKPVSTQTNHNGRLTCSSGFSGSCASVAVDIPTKRKLAFRNGTDSFAYRMFFIGHVGNCFHQSESVDFHDLDGSSISTGRSRILLSNSPKIELYGANGLVTTRPASWVSYGRSPVASETDWVGHEERSFISFLNGDMVAFPFADTFLNDDLITRTYFGPVRCRQSNNEENEPLHAPLPMFGVERFEFGHEVLERLPKLYEEFKKNSELVDFVGILHPIWTALHGVLDDRLALASLSIERLASIWTKSRMQIRPELDCNTSQIWSNRPLLKGIRRELLTAVQELVSQTLVSRLRTHLESSDLTGIDEAALFELSGVLEARLSNLTGAPNSAKLQLPFQEVGLLLNSNEVSAIKQRNAALHGSDQGATSLAVRDEGNRVFDTLRVLVNKFILKLCGYDGPYVDYSSRPDSGNFAIERMR
ncbi:MAG: hypothetical protein KF752_10475 [Pirellulaceae bacterium]|nr:hypothetical protein [Pirellulaceae bacterium]